MNATDKAKFRRGATWRFWVGAPVLVLLSLLVFYLGYARREFADLYRQDTLSRLSMMVSTEFARFYFEKPADLMSFPPPENHDDLDLWGGKIQTRLIQRCAVYTLDGDNLYWVKQPQDFQGAMALIEQSFHSETVAGNRLHPDTVGVMVSAHWSVRPDSSRPGYQLWMVGKATDNKRWGVVLRSEETWSAFFGALSPEYKRRDFYSPFLVLSQEFQLVPPKNKEKYVLTGMRAFLRDQVVYSTPGLDTTRYRFVGDLKDGRKVEYYISSNDELYASEVANRVPWGLILLPLVMIVPLFRSYRVVRKLTAPEV